MGRKTKVAYLLVAVISELLLTSCQNELAIWVIPSSTANNLVFGFSDSRDSDEKVQPEDIRVYPCDSIKRRSDGSYYPNEDHAAWSAWASPDALPSPTNRITYGEGLKNRRPPQNLAVPGCYVVIAYARDKHDITSVATTGFNIDSSGTVIEMSRSEYEDLFKR